MKRAIVIALALVTTIVPARAHVGTQWDGNDVGGPLDIRRAVIDHGGGRLKFKVRMQNDFRARVLRGDSNFVWVDLDTREDQGMDYFAEVKYRRSELRTRVYRIVDRPDTDVDGKRRVGRGRTSFKNGQVIRLSFRKQLVNIQDGNVRWRVVAATYGRNWDETPNNGRMPRHNLS